MRDYAKVSPQFWIGKTGKELRNAGPEATIVALYLLTNPHANMIGMYYLPTMYVAHETGLGFEGASKGLRRCVEAGFCGYDDASEVVFVYQMAEHQIAPSLSATDKRSKGVQNEYDSIPENPFLSMFYERYGAAFKMTKKRGGASPLQAPSKALVSQEQEQEQEQEQDTPHTPRSASELPEPHELPKPSCVGGSHQLAGSVCMAMKRMGLSDTSPGHPKLTALLNAGVMHDQLVEAAAIAARNQKGFAYALSIAERQAEEARGLVEKLASAPAAEQKPSRYSPEAYANQPAVGRL